MLSSPKSVATTDLYETSSVMSYKIKKDVAYTILYTILYYYYYILYNKMLVIRNHEKAGQFCPGR